MRKHIAKFTVNGKDYEIAIEPQTTLVEVLREHIGLTGTKRGCRTGECGVCTVLVEGKSVLSCLTLAVTAREKDILTIEGLARDGVLHPIQKSFIECGAIQCGFCTPGMILSSKTLIDENPNPTIEEIKLALAGNLCRCTGYGKIIDAVLDASRNMGKEGR